MDTMLKPYEVRVTRRTPVEIRAHAAAGEFRGPGEEAVSAAKAALTAFPGATVDRVAEFMAGYGLVEPATVDLAAAALRELRSRGKASQSAVAPFGWTLVRK